MARTRRISSVQQGTPNVEGGEEAARAEPGPPVRAPQRSCAVPFSRPWRLSRSTAPWRGSEDEDESEIEDDAGARRPG